MAALNFPSSPSTNQIYAANGKSWRFDGTSWKTYFILNVQGGGTGNTFYNLGDILVGAGTSLYPLPVGSNNFVLTVDTSAAFGITWRSTAATGITTLNSLTATNQFFSIGSSGNFPSISSSGSTHTFNIPIAGTGATGLVSTLAQSFAGVKTFTNDLVVSSSTISTSTSTGALTVTGGVGIGGSLFLTSSLPSSLSGIVVDNGVITSGSWAGNTITAYYGGTGYNSYTKGDILVGAGNTFIKLGVGTDNFVLTASSSSSTGLTWSPTAATGLTTLNSLSATQQFFATGTSGSGFNISSSGSTHTFNIPLAGSGSTGLISTDSQTIAGQKTFTSAIIGDLTGTATTAGFATTAAYAHQSGYAITSGFATTSSYSYQSGYAITSGLASTATLALTVSSNSTSVNADYNIPFFSGTALSTNNSLYYNPSTGRFNAPIVTGSWAGNTITSFYGGTGYSTYSTGDLLVGAGSTLSKLSVGTNNFILVADSSLPGGIKWASAAGIAITNINGLTASKQDLSFGYSGTIPAFSSSGSTHTLNIPLAGTGSTGLVSTQAQSFAGIKTFTNAVAITDSTGSGSYTTGALVVNGGVGIGGTLNVQGDLNIQGTFTTINSTTITVADKNIELGVVATPTDLTAQGGGITLRGASDKSISWYSGVGWSSSESFNLASGNTFKINGSSVLSNSSLGTGVTNSSLTAVGIISTGVWSATAITAYYGGTGLVPPFTVGDILYANTSNTWDRLTANSNAGYVLTSAGSGATPTYVAQSTLSVGLATTATYSHQSGYATTAGFATTASYAYQSGYGITSGFATTAANINVVNAASGIFFPVLLNTASSASGIGASVNGFFSFNAASGAFGATSVNILSGQSYSVGGNSVLSATSLGTGVTNSSLTALGTITTGVWAGTLITAFYGGTGYNSYTKGDILVGAGNTFIKLNVGTDNYVLTASSSSATGLTWLPTAATGVTTLNSLTATQQYFATGISGSGFNISSSGSTHTFNIPIAGTGATGLVSTLAQTIAGQKTFTSAIIGDLTGTATTAGFATTANYSLQAGYAITSGFATTASYSYESGYGLTSGFATTSANINVVNAASGTFFPVLSNTSSSASGIGASVNGFFSFNTATGAFGATSVNILVGQSYSVSGNSVLSATSLGTGVTNSSLTAVGTITTGTWSATAITAFYGGTGYNSYTVGDLLVGAGSTLYKLPIGTNNFVLTADSTAPGGIKWSVAASTGVTTVNSLTASIQYFATGTSGSGFNISSSGSTHTFNIPIAGTGSTGLVSTLAQSFSGIKTFTNDLVASSSTISTSTSTGALTVTGGVGIGGSLFTGTSTADSISGVVLNNGVITFGSWAGSTITAFYGGTGYNSYTLGDLLVGAGSTFIKLPVGINSYVLGADSSKPSGVGWTTVTPLTVSDTAPASPKNADLWFNSLDGGLLVYYSDVSTAQWIEIALGSGIDLSQPVYITNATASTSTSTGALIVDGGVGVAGAVYASSFSVNGIYDQISSTLVTSNTNANQVALTINASSFRTAKMVVQVTSGSNYHSQEILMVHDDSQVFMTEYAMVNTGAIGSTFDGDISGGNMRFLVTPTNAVTTYKIACSVMRI